MRTVLYSRAHAVELIGDLLESEDFCFLFINMESTRFETCFSKYEMVSGMEIISRVVAEKKIPCFSVKTDVNESGTNGPSLQDIGGPANSPVNSVYDEKFRKQFRDLLRVVPDAQIANFYDVFSTPGLREGISEAGIGKVLICGFDTEREILASTIGAVREGFTPVIMSDCISSKSERIYFEVLDVLSRWTVIGDTRDMVKLWDLW